MALDLADFYEVISFGDVWNKSDARSISVQSHDLVLGEKMKSPFITPQSSNLFYSGGEVPSDSLIQGSKTVDMNFDADTKRMSTDGFDLLSLEKSPWHESDSGVSTTMSEEGSPTRYNDLHATELTTALPDLVWPQLTSEGADDLAAYLLGTDVPMNDNDINCIAGAQSHEEKQIETLPQIMYNTRARSNLAAPKKTLPLHSNEINIDVENSDSECSHSGGISPERHNAQASHPLNYFQDICSESKRKPAVKIVKVLKTTADPDCCDDEIVKALDERSRKNAIQAKMNREKKKKYVNSLETDVEKLGKENKELRDENVELKKDVGDLEEEVRYLKSVLVNASALSGMLRNISGLSDVKLSASIVGRKRGATDCDDHSYTAAASGRAERSAKRARMVHDNLEKAGVCLHVNGGEASLEFCSKCSNLAQRTQSQSRKS